MQERTEEFKEISEEKEDGWVIFFERAGNRSFIKRVFIIRKSFGRETILGQRTNIWTEKKIFSCADEQYCLEKCHCRTWAESSQRLTLTWKDTNLNSYLWPKYCDRIWKDFILILNSKIKLAKFSLFGSHPRGSETRICTPAGAMRAHMHIKIFWTR